MGTDPATQKAKGRRDMRYIIHACPERMWYVTDYLIPSLQEQGIKDIEPWNDTKRLGCLEFCMKIFQSMTGPGGAWHLTDDVIISRNFRRYTEQAPAGIVNGFLWEGARQQKLGMVGLEDMRLSFPCIYIPNHIAKECGEWYFSDARFNALYTNMVGQQKYDDLMFKTFLEIYYPDMLVLNHEKSFVDHIDYLIGGSVVNQERKHIMRAKYFDDPDLVDELEKRLKGDK